MIMRMVFKISPLRVVVFAVFMGAGSALAQGPAAPAPVSPPPAFLPPAGAPAAAPPEPRGPAIELPSERDMPQLALPRETAIENPLRRSRPSAPPPSAATAS